MPGPVPKPREQRRRRNRADLAIELAPAGQEAGRALPPDESWHPIAREWFMALQVSGQAHFYEASDWATARLVAEAMHRLVTADRMSAQLLQSVLQGASSLLATEGDRRRLRLELARGQQVDEDEQASVTALAEYQKRLGG